jgi:hypothetical protein
VRFKTAAFDAVALLLAAILMLSAQISLAGSATWLFSPIDGLWSDPSNWTQGGPPNGPGDTATFATSNKTFINVDVSVEVNSIVFTGDAFSLDLGSLTLSGAGIINNSGVSQDFNGINISFLNTATAGNNTGFFGITMLVFNNSSDAGSATIDNLSLSGNQVIFNDTSNAQGADIINEGGAILTFNDGAGAGTATIANESALSGSDGSQTNFNSMSHANNATISTSGGTGPGILNFNDTSAADSVTIYNAGGASPGDYGGQTDFNNGSSAGSANITNDGSSGGYGGAINFYDTSTADNATITDNGGAGAGTYGGYTAFHGSSTAGNAIIIANGDVNAPNAEGFILFTDNSTGGTAQVRVMAAGTLDISSNSSGVTIGSIGGTGNVFLGNNILTVGNNNSDTGFSGIIYGTGSLAKIGDGILTFGGRATNDYLAGTVGLILVSGSFINLNFCGSPDVIASLTVDGELQPPGVYGSLDSGAPNPLAEFIGPGTVEVPSTPGTTNQAGFTRAIIRGVTAATTFEQRRGVASTEAEIESVPMSVPPTRASFMAAWAVLSGATSYHLDVSTSSEFGTYVHGYRDLDVGHVTSRIVSGLMPGTTYHYRVRAYSPDGVLSTSAVETVTTTGGQGLVIDATFDSSITGDPNAAAIEAMISQAISVYEVLFNDPITVSILFRYSTTLANGCTPLQPLDLGRSQTGIDTSTPWDTFVAALTANATSINDAIAIASLPQPTATPLSSNVWVSTANGRALGLNTPPRMCADGSIGIGCPYDGIVTLNYAAHFQFTRPLHDSTKFDARSTTEHEIDEVLGLGSFLDFEQADPEPQDLFSWSSPGMRNLTRSGNRYFSIDSGRSNIVEFNQHQGGDFGDWASSTCPQANPYVQNAFSCPGQVDDVSAFSPEGTNLDIIGYNFRVPPFPRPTPPPHITPVPPPPSPRPTAHPRPTPPPHLTPVPPPPSPRPTPAPRP